jgi:hypothetical protein
MSFRAIVIAAAVVRLVVGDGKCSIPAVSRLTKSVITTGAPPHFTLAAEQPALTAVPSEGPPKKPACDLKGIHWGFANPWWLDDGFIQDEMCPNQQGGLQKRKEIMETPAIIRKTVTLDSLVLNTQAARLIDNSYNVR